MNPRWWVAFYVTAALALENRMLHNKRALQKSHEKPQWLQWSEAFIGTDIDQQSYLVKLLKKITLDYLSDCTTVILYDMFTENLLIEKLLRDFPATSIHGQITPNYTMMIKDSESDARTVCYSYMLFVKDVMRCKDVIGVQENSKVVIVSRSSQWRVFEFLSHEESRSFSNLLVIVKSENVTRENEEAPYILYTHNLYTDALGSSRPHVLTSYQKGDFTRKVNLFPKKIVKGFSGHRFIIAVAQQPPFAIFRGKNNEGENIFGGIEVRLVNLLAQLYNFTTDYREFISDALIGPSEAITRVIESNKVNLGIGGLYVTEDKLERIGMSQYHSRDCAVFVSLTSTALPRYRAIMGPFQWTVWMALTLTYLFGIIPLFFSDKHTLEPLLKDPVEIENTFWYMFGTFTNCFTFMGRTSWSKADKLSTKLLIGFYWLFTIIITSCYTGSIIAFVTLPIYPEVVDTVNQLVNGGYQVGTLDTGVWPSIFTNMSDEASEKFRKYLDLVPDVESGLKNITKAFFWKYAFLGSRAQLDYMIRANVSVKNRRSVLHISNECFLPFNVALAYPKNSIYGEVINNGMSNIIQSGIMIKLKSDVEWDIMRSSTGTFLSANSRSTGIKTLSIENRALTLQDTEGMFLLLGVGFLVAAASLLSEWLGGCFNLCKRKKRRSSDSSIESNPRFHEGRTLRQPVIFRDPGAPNFEENRSDNVARSEINDHDNAQHSYTKGYEHFNAEDVCRGIDRIFENVFGEENNVDLEDDKSELNV